MFSLGPKTFAKRSVTKGKPPALYCFKSSWQSWVASAGHWVSEIAFGLHIVTFSKTCNFIRPSPIRIAVWTTIHGQNLLAWSRMQCIHGLAFGSCHHAPHFPFGSSSHSKSASPRVLFSFKAHRSNGEISRPGLTASDSREWGSWCVLFFETS